MDHPSSSSAHAHQRDVGEGTRPRGKRPYIKPAFVREAVFEATALACGKIDPRAGQCNMVSKKS
jgi:hypothetical protein